MRVPHPRHLLTSSTYMPYVRVPTGRIVELPGRGSTFVTDTPGPSPQAQTVVLLHALGCTGLLTWFPSIPRLAQRYRVVTLDQRWHGQGVRSETFSLRDCADDVAALLDVLGVERALVAGYSMGGVVAQRVWRQHPDRVAGLVLAATSDRFQLTVAERAFFTGMGVSMLGTRGIARSRVATRAARSTARALDVDASDVRGDIQAWALREFRSTSPWAVAAALTALGRHHSRPWLGRVDAPTAVVVTTRDRIIPPARQLALARAVPGATVHDIEAGHAACVLEAEVFVPAVVEAAATVTARVR